ncbi:hypothetical protein, partial [Acidomonas methanolica]|uniref:hypothetical protein n=1 Tax=Acidomonas methanolica TaxID=437 RepID=UPI00211A084A
WQFIDAVLLGSVLGALADARALPDGINTVGAHGHTALEAASYRGDLKMVTALLAAGAKPDGAPDRAPIGLAFTRKDTDAMIPVSYPKRRPLIKATDYSDGRGHRDISPRLLSPIFKMRKPRQQFGHPGPHKVATSSVFLRHMGG